MPSEIEIEGQRQIRRQERDKGITDLCWGTSVEERERVVSKREKIGG